MPHTVSPSRSPSAPSYSDQEMHALMRHPAIRARLLSYQLLTDQNPSNSRMSRLIQWIASLFSAEAPLKLGSSEYLKDRLIALGISTKLSSKDDQHELTDAEKSWYKRHEKDGEVDQLFAPGQSSFLARQVKEAMEARLEVFQRSFAPEDRLIEQGEWKKKRVLMSNLVLLTNPSLSKGDQKEIADRIQELYQRSVSEKVQLVGASLIQGALSSGLLNRGLQWAGVDPSSTLSAIGTMQTAIYTGQYLRGNIDFLPARGALFASNMLFLHRGLQTAGSFITGARLFSSFELVDAMQLAGSTSILLSYCPWKRVANKVSAFANLLFTGYSLYFMGSSAYRGVSNLYSRVHQFFWPQNQCPLVWYLSN